MTPDQSPAGAETKEHAMTTTRIAKTVTVAGERLSIARIVAHARQRMSEGAFVAGESAPHEADYVWQYLLSMLARRAAGKRGEVVNCRADSWTEDGSYTHYEVTFGKPKTGNPGWTACQRAWVEWRLDELDEAEAAVRAYLKAVTA